jgi:hypothetical protein
LAVLARKQGWHHTYGGLYSDAYNMYVGLEAAARRLITYHEHIPGLLQTADYARAVIGAYPGFSPTDVERRVEHRLKRQAIVMRKTNPLMVEALLHQSALYRSVGGRRVMLRCLAEVSKRPNVTLRIHPYEAGMAWGMPYGMFTLLEFDTNAKGDPVEPPIVYLEGGPMQDVYLEKPDEVKAYTDLGSAIRGDCLDEQQSRDMIRRVIREFERDQR